MHVAGARSALFTALTVLLCVHCAKRDVCVSGYCVKETDTVQTTNTWSSYIWGTVYDGLEDGGIFVYTSCVRVTMCQCNCVAFERAPIRVQRAIGTSSEVCSEAVYLPVSGTGYCSRALGTTALTSSSYTRIWSRQALTMSPSPTPGWYETGYLSDGPILTASPGCEFSR